MESLSRLSGRNFGGWSSAAPQISLEDEKREWEAIAEEERQRILAEAYGSDLDTSAKSSDETRTKVSSDQEGSFLATDKLENAEKKENENCYSRSNVKIAADEYGGEARIDHLKSLKFIKLSPDLYNQSPSSPETNDENGENDIAHNIRKYVETHISQTDRDAFSEACSRCPSEALSTSHLMMFWRWSAGDVKSAAGRLVAYWEERRKLFGDDLAFQPLTVEHRSRKEWIALSAGYMRPVVVRTNESNKTELLTDRHGRALIFGTCVRQVVGDRYSNADMLRVLWLTLQTILETYPEIQQNGFVFMVTTRGASMAQLNRKLFLRFWETCTNALPVAVRAFHICRPSRLFVILRPAIMHILGRFVRIRTFVHLKEETLLEELAEFGIEPACIPTDLGGDAVIEDYHWWCEQQGGACVIQNFLRGEDWANV